MRSVWGLVEDYGKNRVKYIQQISLILKEIIMRISDDVTDKKLDRITLFLTEPEAIQLESYLKPFLEKPKEKELHFHLSSEDYQKEITVCIYNPENIRALHSRAQKLIRDFEGVGGPFNLPEILQIFRDWAESCQKEIMNEKPS